MLMIHAHDTCPSPPLAPSRLLSLILSLTTKDLSRMPAALGDVERHAGLPISTLCDREKRYRPRQITAWLPAVRLPPPLFVTVQRVLPGTYASAMVTRLDANRCWLDWEPGGNGLAADASTADESTGGAQVVATSA